MIDFSEDIKSTLAETRIRTTETAYNHVTTAIGLFDSYAYSQACFLAITAIEEMGKARTLQMVQSDIYPKKEPEKIDAKGIQDFLRNHKTKAIRAAASGLSVNHGAVRRHGRHEVANLNLSSGILLLAKSGKWMNIRNSCIYTDTNISGKSVNWPTEEIQAHHAYYFICMSLEIMAEEAEAGLGAVMENFEKEDMIIDFETATSFRTAMLGLLDDFMLKYETQFKPKELEFFTNDPRYDSLRDEIKEREVNLNEERRERLQDIIIDDLEEVEGTEKLDIPEDFDIDTYQASLIPEMVDIAMDTTYFAPDHAHPDLEDLSEHIQQYVEY